MTRRLLQVIKHLVIIFGLLLVQVAIVPALPGALINLNAVLLVLVLTAVIYDFRLAFIYSLIWGFLLDLYSALPFGLMLVVLPLVIYCLHKIFNRLFTNKSFYGLLGLGVVGTAVYSLAIYFYLVLKLLWQTRDLALAQSLTVISGVNFLWQLLLNLFFLIILFGVLNLLSRKFKTVFIDTTR